MNSEPSGLTPEDVDALIRALAETISRVNSGEVRHCDIRNDLYYSINPWNTTAAFEVIERLCKRLEDEHWNGHNPDWYQNWTD